MTTVGSSQFHITNIPTYTLSSDEESFTQLSLSDTANYQFDQDSDSNYNENLSHHLSSSLHSTTNPEFDFDLPLNHTNFQLSTIPLSTMSNFNQVPPLYNLPIRGSKQAPKTFRGKYSEANRFIKH